MLGLLAGFEHAALKKLVERKYHLTTGVLFRSKRVENDRIMKSS